MFAALSLIVLASAAEAAAPAKCAGTKCPPGQGCCANDLICGTRASAQVACFDGSKRVMTPMKHKVIPALFRHANRSRNRRGVPVARAIAERSSIVRSADQHEIGGECRHGSSADDRDHGSRRAVGKPADAPRLVSAPAPNCSAPANAAAAPARFGKTESAPEIAFDATTVRSDSTTNRGSAMPTTAPMPSMPVASRTRPPAARIQQAMRSKRSVAAPNHNAAVDERRRDHPQRVHAEQKPVILRRHAEIFDVDKGRTGNEREQTAKIKRRTGNVTDIMPAAQQLGDNRIALSADVLRCGATGRASRGAQARPGSRVPRNRPAPKKIARNRARAVPGRRSTAPRPAPRRSSAD